MQLLHLKKMNRLYFLEQFWVYKKLRKSTELPYAPPTLCQFPLFASCLKCVIFITTDELVSIIIH